MKSVNLDDREYHRRRSEMELESAVSCEDRASALAHLELARIHRARRQMIAEDIMESPLAHDGGPIFRTDKEA